jgi:hypothetical protein
MTDWRTAMRDAARRDEQDELSPAEVEAMRRVVMAATEHQPEPRAESSWLRPMFVVASVAAMIVAGTVTAIKMDLPARFDSPVTDLGGTSASSIDSTARSTNIEQPNRQLQFLTPGGTRIIWVFNSDLNLKATTR